MILGQTHTIEGCCRRSRREPVTCNYPVIPKAARLDPDIADVTTIRNIPLNH
jgi:hypothetical protein